MATTKVNSEFIAVNAISGTIIADGAITSTHLAANCVDSSEIVTGSIDTIHIAANQVTSAKIVSNGVLTRHISDDQVTGDKLTNNITIAGTLTSTGAFTSPGIDDNADAIAITIDSSENVGIGTTSPDRKLDVSGTGNVYGKFQSTNATGAGIEVKDTGEDWLIQADDGTGSGGLAFYDLGRTAYRMFLDASGNLGIGTTSPSQKLDVNGTVELNNLTVGGAQGSDGQLLTSTGSGVAWEDAPSGGPTFKEGGTNFTNSIMIGDNSTGTLSSAERNTGVGKDVFAALTSGTGNHAFGYQALDALTTGVNNVAIGETALGANQTGNYNVAVGHECLAASTSSYNVAIGYKVLDAQTSGANNVGIGYRALSATNGSWNVAIGTDALRTEATSGSNVAIGGLAMQTSNGASNCTAIGKQTGYLHTTGDYDTWVGSNAGFNSTTGSSNTAVGYTALYTNSTGSSNVCIGKAAGYAISVGNENVMIGDNAGSGSTGAVNGNVAIGHQAFYNQTGGGYNVAIGVHSLYNGSSGHSNTCIGYSSGYHTGNGYRNVAIGYSVSIPSNSNHRFAIGYNNAGGQNTQDYALSVHNGSSAYVRLLTGSTTVSASSDERIKKNIEDCTYGLSFINRLRPVNYKLKLNSELPAPWKDEEVEDYDQGWMNGFIAQEVKAALDAESIPAEKVELWSEDADNGGLQSLGEAALIPMLVKALQEADDKIDALTARIETLEG